MLGNYTFSITYIDSLLTMSDKTVRIAVIQSSPVAFNLKESLAKVEQFTSQATKSGAELIVFPSVASSLALRSVLTKS